MVVFDKEVQERNKWRAQTQATSEDAPQVTATGTTMYCHYMYLKELLLSKTTDNRMSERRGGRFFFDLSGKSTWFLL